MLSGRKGSRCREVASRSEAIEECSHGPTIHFEGRFAAASALTSIRGGWSKHHLAFASGLVTAWPV